MTVAALRELQAAAARAARATALMTGIHNALVDDILELADLILGHHEGQR